MINRDTEEYRSKPLTALRFRLAQVAVAAFFLNLVSYGAVASHIGGDAVNGKAVGDHYYLGYKGTFTEVSHGVYTYSLWHTRSLVVTFIVGLVATLSIRGDENRRRRQLVKDQIKKGGYPHWPTT